jgi:hypothetical protein
MVLRRVRLMLACVAVAVALLAILRNSAPVALAQDHSNEPEGCDESLLP